MLLTAEQLQKVATTEKGLRLSLDRCQKLTALLNEVCPRYGIVNADIFHEFIAQLLHESDCFRNREENLNYRADRILEVWRKRFKNLAEAALYARNPQKLANRVYANRNGNGDIASGDGWRFRGGGPIQLTGRETYTLCYHYIKKMYGAAAPKTLDEFVQLVRTDDRWGIESACWFFSVFKKLIPLALADQFKTITQRVNGGYMGMKERIWYYELAKKHIV